MNIYLDLCYAIGIRESMTQPRSRYIYEWVCVVGHRAAFESARRRKMEDLPCVLLGLGFGPRAAFESVVFVEAKRLGGFRVWGKNVGPPMHFARCVFWASGRV